MAAKKDALVAQTENVMGWTNEQVDLIKTKFLGGKGTQNDLALFLNVASKRGLDPFSSQICALWHHDKKTGREQMTIVTQIHGLRAIADRCGTYAPGRQTEYNYNDKDELVSATAFIKKFVHGTWHEHSETAQWREYCPEYFAPMWKRMPHVMLAKCAEALALRRAFPSETSGLYIAEEMDQARSYPLAIDAEPVVREVSAAAAQDPEPTPLPPPIDEPPFEDYTDETGPPVTPIEELGQLFSGTLAEATTAEDLDNFGVELKQALDGIRDGAAKDELRAKLASAFTARTRALGLTGKLRKRKTAEVNP